MISIIEKIQELIEFLRDYSDDDADTQQYKARKNTSGGLTKSMLFKKLERTHNAELKMLKKQELYKTFLNHTSSAVLVVDRKSILFFNKAFLDLTGYDSEEIFENRKKFLGSLFIRSSVAIWDKVRSFLTQTDGSNVHEVYTCEDNIRTKVNSYVPVNIRISRADVKGQVVVIFSIDNIVTLVNYKNYYTQQKKKFELLFDTIPMSMAISNITSLYDWIEQKEFSNVNELSEFVLGTDINELENIVNAHISILGVNHHAIKMTRSNNMYEVTKKYIHKFFSNRDNIFLLLSNLFKKNRKFSADFNLNGQALTYNWVIPDSSSDFRYDLSHTLIFSTECSSNFTKRSLETKFLKSYGDLIQWQNDINGKLVFCNTRFFELFLKDYPYSKLISRKYNKDIFDFTEMIEMARSNEKGCHFIKRIDISKDSFKWIDCWYFPLFTSPEDDAEIVSIDDNMETNLIGFIGIAIDITQFSDKLTSSLGTFIYEGKIKKITEGSYCVINPIDFSDDTFDSNV